MTVNKTLKSFSHSDMMQSRLWVWCNVNTVQKDSQLFL